MSAVKEKYNVRQDYIVYSANPLYKGESGKQEFNNGKAQLYGLTDSATAEESAERRRILEWFTNAPGYRIEEASHLRPKAD
jgi:hypothetical protein